MQSPSYTTRLKHWCPTINVPRTLWRNENAVSHRPNHFPSQSKVAASCPLFQRPRPYRGCNCLSRPTACFPLPSPKRHPVFGPETLLYWPACHSAMSQLHGKAIAKRRRRWAAAGETSQSLFTRAGHEGARKEGYCDSN
jgi:hypothetical protein